MNTTVASSVLAAFGAAGMFAQVAPPAPPAPPVLVELPNIFVGAVELPEIPEIPELPVLAGLQDRLFAAYGDEGGEVRVQTTPQPLYGSKHLTIVTKGGSYLGVGFKEIDAERAKELKLPEPLGVEITHVDPDSPAAKAGLKEGDVLIEYNAQRVEGTEQFVRLVRETPAGRQVKLHVKRGGASQTLVATITGRPTKNVEMMMSEAREKSAKMREDMTKMRMDLPDMAGSFFSVRSAMLGIEAESMSEQLAEFFGVKQGVLVRSVGKGTAAEKAGLKAGDVIVKVSGQEVATPSQVSGMIRKTDPGKAFPITVVRNRLEITLNAVIDSPFPAGSEVRPIRATPLKPFVVHSLSTAGRAQ